MLDKTSEIVGSYSDMVEGLQAKLRQADEERWLSSVPCSKEPLSVLAVGHGGRDSLCTLAVVEAIANDPKLRGRVQVHICTCSWSDDVWEPVLEQYLAHMEKMGVIDKDAVQVHSMKFHREHNSICAKLREQLKHKNVVVQCEQGVDFFVEPVSNQWLQDNYEDNFVHHVCMESAQSAGIPVFVLQTNTDLDLPRGINADDINTNIFRGVMKTNAFSQKICFEKVLQAKEVPIQ